MDFSMYLLIFIIGAIFGSFTNVIIYRIPKKISLLRPSSSCTQCGYHLKWYENVPIVSFLLLKGKCKQCNKRIPFSYLLVELLMGFGFIILSVYTRNILHFAYFAFILVMFISMSIIDYKHYMLPDKLIIITAIISIMYYSYSKNFMIGNNLLSAAIIFSSLFFLRILSSRLFKKESLGMGDIKLGALIGFILGWKGALLAIFFGFYLAAITLLFLYIFRILKKKNFIPFGPFMFGGMIIYIIWGRTIIYWYFQYASGQ